MEWSFNFFDNIIFELFGLTQGYTSDTIPNDKYSFLYSILSLFWGEKFDGDRRKSSLLSL